MILQHYLLNINDSKLIQITRAIETNDLRPDQKRYLIHLLKTIIDQRVEIENVKR